MFEESVSSLPSIWASMNSWLTPTVLFLLLQLMIGIIFVASSLGTQKHHDQDNHHHHQQGLARSPSVLQRFKSINFYAYRSPEPATNYEKPPESETHFAYLPHAQEVEQPKLPRSPSMLERLQSKFQLHFPKGSSPLQPRDFAAPEPHFSTYEHSHEDEDEDEDEDDEESEEEAKEAEELDEDQFEAEEGEEEEEDEEKEQTLEEIYSQLHLQDHHVSRTKSDTKPASGDLPAKLPKKMKKSASTKSAFAHFEADDIVESRRPATVKEKKAKAAEDDAEVDSKADDFINRFKQQLKLQRLDSIVRYKDMVNRGSDK